MKTPAVVWWVLGAALLWIGLKRFESFMIFIPSRELTAHPGTVGLPWEKLWLETADGPRLRAWWIPGPKADSPVMLCLHGNAGNLSNRVDKMKVFREAGAAQLWVEWRGYGESSGTPSEQGLYRDARAGWDWLTKERGVPPSRVVIYGESVGCGAAVELATEVPAGKLIVESGFASIPEMAKVVLPRLPRFLISTRFDNLAKLTDIRMPKLFLHSKDDDVVPYEQARRNFAAAAEPKLFVELKGTHNDGFLDSQPDYGRAIADFLAR